MPTIHRILSSALPAALALLTTACAGATHGSRADASVSESNVRRLLTALADDSLQGRATGAPGAAKAAAIIANEMRAIGLEPAGDSGYFQRVPLAMAMRVMRDSSRREALALLPSLAARDTVSPGRRRAAVNVIGIIRGADPVLRDSVVLIDAHYDHVGVGRPVNGDSIYNGADDDASGTVAVLEIARAMMAGPRPKRTMIFAAMTGEEVGLLGTRWYILHPVAPIERMTANLEIEMIGRPDSLAGGPGRGWLTGYERSTMGASFAAAGLPIVPDRRPEQSFFTRSDNIAFARAGVVAHTLSSFNLHSDYHQPSDDASRVDYAHMTALIRAAAAASRLLADGPSPVWHPGGRPPATVTPPRPTTVPVSPAPTIPPHQ